MHFYAHFQNINFVRVGIPLRKAAWVSKNNDAVRQACLSLGFSSGRDPPSEAENCNPHTVRQI
jgi:hypothetical protein